MRQNYKNVEETRMHQLLECDELWGDKRGKGGAENEEGFLPRSVSEDEILRFIASGQWLNE